MAYIELLVNQGATFQYNLDLKNKDQSPLNVTGATFSGQIRKSYYSTTATADLNITVANTTNGNVVISMSSATTSAIKAGRYVYDVKMLDNANTTTRILEGIVTVTPQVTK
jgi:hypothetical protein